MSVTSAALNRPRFTLVAAVILALIGLSVLFGFPSTEEPTVPVRTATVQVFWPGATPDRQEQLIAQPLEEKIREIPEVSHIETIIRPSFTIAFVYLRAGTAPADLPVLWQRLKDKVSQASMPEGASAPVVNDEYGRVAVRSLALTGPGYSAGQLQDWAKKVRERLQSVRGTQAIALYGVQEERVYVELSPDRLAAAGITPQTVAQALAARNVVASAGEIETKGLLLTLTPSGDVPTVADLASVLVSTPNGGTLPLSALGKIEQRTEDPPTSAVLFNGNPAVVLGVSMLPSLNVNDFADRLNTRIAEIEKEIPVGMRLQSVTDQSIVVAKQISEVGRVFLETVVIVLAVVVGFLGWRSGVVTGLIVPITVLGTLAIMKALSIELHQVSIAAIIISLGLFVDNAIVVVEDFQRRVHHGEKPRDAAEQAGRGMAAPLLTSTCAIILSFVPLVSGESYTSEYMRSLGYVVAITLSLSLFLALTLTPVLARLQAELASRSKEEPSSKAWIAIKRWFAEQVSGRIAAVPVIARYRIANATRDSNAVDAMTRVRSWYVSKVNWLLQRPLRVIGAMAALFIVAFVSFSMLPQELLAPSERKQIQIPIELDPGSSSRNTLALSAKLSRELADKKTFPELTDNAVYVGDGGPRFIVSLNPPSPATNRAYAIVSLREDASVEAAIAHVRAVMTPRYPEAKLTPKRFSLGASEAGTAVFRLLGPDRAVLTEASEKLTAALRGEKNVYDITRNAEGRIPYLSVDVSQTQAISAGVTNSQIAGALGTAYSGITATVLRQGNTLVPVLIRAPEADRFSPERLTHLPVAASVRLGDVAAIRLDTQASVLTRRDMFPSMEVSAKGTGLTAQQIVSRMQPVIAQLHLPSGTSVEYGGELEDSTDANEGLINYLPFALLGMATLFLWQFGSLRKTIIILISIPFVLIGATIGLWVTNQPVSFSATLGLLALGGIIVNNAVLLIERIQYECNQGKDLLAAISDGAALRLRPILMTTLTCVCGLLPLFAFGGPLWRPLAATMIGGLGLGTLVTLVLVPSLYAVVFRHHPLSKQTGDAA
jgi:multidrug efflux pump subunit AcrB